MNQFLLDQGNLEPGLCSALDRLKLGDFQTRWDVAKTIPNYGAAATAPLLTILEEEETDWELLWFVARILGNLNQPSVIAALVNLLKTADNAEVSSMAASALTHYGVAAVAPLSELLQDESTRLLAVQALVQIRHAEAVTPLLSAVNDPSPAIRSAAIEALSYFYDPAISAVLLAALDDLNPTVRKAAVMGLGIQAQQFDPLELTEPLKQRLWDFNPEVCSQAATALGRVKTDAAANALFEVLRSSHTPLFLQIEAVRALSWMDTVYALDGLRQFLQATDTKATDTKATDTKDQTIPLPSRSLLPTPHSPSLQQEIITVLGRVESAEAKGKAVEMLLELFSSKSHLLQDSKSKQTIALSLGQLGQLQALDPLILMLADANASVRFHAIAALKQLHSEQAYERLQALARDENIAPELQAGVTIALQEWQS